MMNFTGQLKDDIEQGKRLFKAAGIAGITSNEYMTDGYACESDNGAIYQCTILIGNDDQTRPGDCGSLHSEELDNHQFLPLGIHIGSAEESRYQAALMFNYNFRALCQHFELNPSDFTFHNLRDPSNIQIVQGAMNNSGAAAACADLK